MPQAEGRVSVVVTLASSSSRISCWQRPYFLPPSTRVDGIPYSWYRPQ